jgi:hypothetical protein
MAALADVKTRTDSAIHEDVVYELKWTQRLPPTKSPWQLVPLSGFVCNYMEKDAAEKAAKRGTDCARRRTMFK